MFKVLVAEDEPKSRGALISRLRGILGDAALIEACLLYTSDAADE